MSYKPSLQELYRKEIIPAMTKKFEYENVMQVPRLKKITLNMGIGDAVKDPKVLESAIQDLTVISGQKPATTTAKKAISNFKLREGMNIGCKVTIRGQRMYEFLERFVSVAAPRIRDFRGLSRNSFDGRGNYNVGIKEHLIFTEIDIDKVNRIYGMDISIVTDAKSDAEALELLTSFGVPFKKK